MSACQDKTSLSCSRSRENVSGGEWGRMEDACASCFDEATGDAIRAGMDAVQPGIDGHLPLPRGQRGLMLGLVEEGFAAYHGRLGSDPDSDYLDIPSVPNYSESNGNVATKKRSSSNSSRHRGEVVTELGPEEVRWFYKEDKRTWKPFVGHDSLKIELAYRKFCELNPNEVRRRDVGEEAENLFESSSGCEAPAVRRQSAAAVAAQPVPESADAGCSTDETELDSESINVDAVCVRGGLYEVDIKKKDCYPVYWNQQDHIPVMRGQWFTDGTWLPLEEEDSDLIELEHLARFRGQQMKDTFDTEAVATTVDSKDAIHSLKLSRSHVDWHSVDEVYLYSDATTSKIARTVTQKLGFSKASSSGTRLHQGYVEEAAPEDTPPETTHIVFVVHGIGQKMDQGRIIRNTSMMRDAARKMEEKHFSERTNEHVEFLPVEWRSKLALDGDTVDSITPDKVRGLRDMLNSSAMDIMYYTSPLYRDEITRGLTKELNRLYTLFCERNPEFAEKGKVSIVSHSLGCVITFDIMTGWDPVRFVHEEVPDAMEADVSRQERQLLEDLRNTCLRMRNLEDTLRHLQTSSSKPFPALKFKVENFFCMGSPLAVFLALRGVRPGTNGTQDHFLPKSICQRLFNIFHPTDPVAYRLEPLILKHYSNISPVQIHCVAWRIILLVTAITGREHSCYEWVHLVRNDVQIPDSFVVNNVRQCPIPSGISELRMTHGRTTVLRLAICAPLLIRAASIGKGIGGILFSRFSRSSGQVCGVEEEPLDSEGGACEKGEECRPVELDDKLEEKTEEKIEEKTGDTSMSQSASTIMDNSSLELEKRIDFELREGLVESRYWSAVTSHTAYWCSHDVALFLLTFMYRPNEANDMPEDNPES
ncbi:phospholipase DDHD1-like [Sinocyclocheilus anshuiensis]|uniref:phospholipase DDHD1-like n=1 Tax=Sinocyclocheilus anshuiensis TaxID=1608454 RepID=UPI0007BABE5E|nr:PREDICTED: phospholipase DDHD1-like [Sinocyclocheilus anshuiensis]